MKYKFPSFLRFTSGAILALAAVALAVTATKVSIPPQQAERRPFAPKKFDPDQSFSKRTAPGPERDRDPGSVAEQDYDNRAYPATDIPIEL